jgi:hypothetical protein
MLGAELLIGNAAKPQQKKHLPRRRGDTEEIQKARVKVKTSTLRSQNKLGIRRKAENPPGAFASTGSPARIYTLAGRKGGAPTVRDSVIGRHFVIHSIVKNNKNYGQDN